MKRGHGKGGQCYVPSHQLPQKIRDEQNLKIVAPSQPGIGPLGEAMCANQVQGQTPLDKLQLHQIQGAAIVGEFQHRARQGEVHLGTSRGIGSQGGELPAWIDQHV
jgi:hypothetical protein